MSRQFQVSINLGNEDMRTSADVTSALQGVADRVYGEDLPVGAVGVIRDRNGNNVGQWAVVEIED